MVWQIIGYVIEAAWGGLILFALVGMARGWLWDHRPWRDRRTFGERYTEIMDLKWREFQARELANLEAEVQAQGCDIWRPDPARVQTLSEAR